MKLLHEFIIILGDPTESVVQNDPVVRPRPGNRVQNRYALRRNNRNVIGK